MFHETGWDYGLGIEAKGEHDPIQSEGAREQGEWVAMPISFPPSATYNLRPETA
jgi:hypothetical protein